MIDEIGVRAETPGCQDRVFLDSAGASLPPQRVVRAMVRHLRREAEVGGYRAAEECSAERQDLKVSLGRLLGCESRCIALTDSATRAWTTFFSAVPLQPGDRILMARSEYANNAINLLHRAGLTSARVEIVPSTPDGRIDLHRLAEVMDDRVRLISVVHVPNNTGWSIRSATLSRSPTSTVRSYSWTPASRSANSTSTSSVCRSTDWLGLAANGFAALVAPDSSLFAPAWNPYSNRPFSIFGARGGPSPWAIRLPTMPPGSSCPRPTWPPSSA